MPPKPPRAVPLAEVAAGRQEGDAGSDSTTSEHGGDATDRLVVAAAAQAEAAYWKRKTLRGLAGARAKTALPGAVLKATPKATQASSAEASDAPPVFDGAGVSGSMVGTAAAASSSTGALNRELIASVADLSARSIPELLRAEHRRRVAQQEAHDCTPVSWNPYIGKLDDNNNTSAALTCKIREYLEKVRRKIEERVVTSKTVPLNLDSLAECDFEIWRLGTRIRLLRTRQANLVHSTGMTVPHRDSMMNYCVKHHRVLTWRNIHEGVARRLDKGAKPKLMPTKGKTSNFKGLEALVPYDPRLSKLAEHVQESDYQVKIDAAVRQNKRSLDIFSSDAKVREYYEPAGEEIVATMLVVREKLNQLKSQIGAVMGGAALIKTDIEAVNAVGAQAVVQATAEISKGDERPVFHVVRPKSGKGKGKGKGKAKAEDEGGSAEPENEIVFDSKIHQPILVVRNDAGEWIRYNPETAQYNGGVYRLQSGKETSPTMLMAYREFAIEEDSQKLVCYLRPITSDYDPLAIGFFPTYDPSKAIVSIDSPSRFCPSRARKQQRQKGFWDSVRVIQEELRETKFNHEMGHMTTLEKEVLVTLKAFTEGAINHGPETNHLRPEQITNDPCAAFLPDATVELLRGEADILQFTNTWRNKGYHIPVNPGWGWRRSGWDGISGDLRLPPKNYRRFDWVNIADEIGKERNFVHDECVEKSISHEGVQKVTEEEIVAIVAKTKRDEIPTDLEQLQLRYYRYVAIEEELRELLLMIETLRLEPDVTPAPFIEPYKWRIADRPNEHADDELDGVRKEIEDLFLCIARQDDPRVRRDSRLFACCTVERPNFSELRAGSTEEDILDTCDTIQVRLDALHASLPAGRQRREDARMLREKAIKERQRLIAERKRQLKARFARYEELFDERSKVQAEWEKVGRRRVLCRGEVDTPRPSA